MRLCCECSINSRATPPHGPSQAAITRGPSPLVSQSALRGANGTLTGVRPTCSSSMVPLLDMNAPTDRVRGVRLPGPNLQP